MQTDIQQLKSALRVRIRATLASLDPAEEARRSTRLFERLICLPEFERAGTVFAYVSFAREAGTHHLIRHSLRVGKKVCVPAFDRERKQYFAVAIEDFDWDLRVGHYGIMEPRDERPTNQQADVALVPGLAFDRHGHRLGRGKGYFDRLLRDFHRVKIALAFDFQVFESVPADSYDVPMDIVVTDEQVVRVPVQSQDRV